MCIRAASLHVQPCADTPYRLPAICRYWPELDVARGILPRRAFLVAKHDIPTHVELTWDYGKHYERHWLNARHGTGSAWSRGVGASGDALASDSDDEQVGTTQLSGHYAINGSRRKSASAHEAVPHHRADSDAGSGDDGGEGPIASVAAVDDDGYADEDAREAVIREAQEQLLSAEELLPWDALEMSWGSTRHDWLRRVQRASEARVIAAPLGELEASIRPWALGESWPQTRRDFLQRLSRVQSMQARNPEEETSALLRLLLYTLQPVLNGEVSAPSNETPSRSAQSSGQTNPFKERLLAMQQAGGAPARVAPEHTPAAPDAMPTTLSSMIATTVSTSQVQENGEIVALEVLPASSVCLHGSDHPGIQADVIDSAPLACDASSEDEMEEREDDEGGRSEEVTIDMSTLPAEAQGVALYHRKSSQTGYTGVIRRGSVFALRRSSRYSIDGTSTFETAVDAAVAYARRVAAVKADASEEDDVWFAPSGKEYRVPLSGLTSFCRKHDLTRSAMVKLRKGTLSHHKGWRLSRRGTEDETETPGRTGEGGHTKFTSASMLPDARDGQIADGPKDAAPNGAEGTSTRRSRADHSRSLPQLGEIVKVEVEESGVISWRPAEVRQQLRGRKFVVCVDNDELFIETFSMAEEGIEWMRCEQPAIEVAGGSTMTDACQGGSGGTSCTAASHGVGMPGESGSVDEHTVSRVDGELDGVGERTASSGRPDGATDDPDAAMARLLALQDECRGGRVRKAPARLTATEDPRTRPLWYRKMLQAKKEAEQGETDGSAADKLDTTAEQGQPPGNQAPASTHIRVTLKSSGLQQGAQVTQANAGDATLAGGAAVSEGGASSAGNVVADGADDEDDTDVIVLADDDDEDCVQQVAQPVEVEPSGVNLLSAPSADGMELGARGRLRGRGRPRGRGKSRTSAHADGATDARAATAHSSRSSTAAARERPESRAGGSPSSDSDDEASALRSNYRLRGRQRRRVDYAEADDDDDNDDGTDAGQVRVASNHFGDSRANPCSVADDELALDEELEIPMGEEELEQLASAHGFDSLLGNWIEDVSALVGSDKGAQPSPSARYRIKRKQQLGQTGQGQPSGSTLGVAGSSAAEMTRMPRELSAGSSAKHSSDARLPRRRNPPDAGDRPRIVRRGRIEYNRGRRPRSHSRSLSHSPKRSRGRGGRSPTRSCSRSQSRSLSRQRGRSNERGRAAHLRGGNRAHAEEYSRSHSPQRGRHRGGRRGTVWRSSSRSRSRGRWRRRTPSPSPQHSSRFSERPWQKADRGWVRTCSTAPMAVPASGSESMVREEVPGGGIKFTPLIDLDGWSAAPETRGPWAAPLSAPMQGPGNTAALQAPTINATLGGMGEPTVVRVKQEQQYKTQQQAKLSKLQAFLGGGGPREVPQPTLHRQPQAAPEDPEFRPWRRAPSSGGAASQGQPTRPPNVQDFATQQSSHGPTKLLPSHSRAPGQVPHLGPPRQVPDHPTLAHEQGLRDWHGLAPPRSQGSQDMPGLASSALQAKWQGPSSSASQYQCGWRGPSSSSSQNNGDWRGPVSPSVQVKQERPVLSTAEPSTSSMARGTQAPPVPPRFRQELIQLLEHRRSAPLDLHRILPEHCLFFGRPRPLEPRELGCSTLGFGNGDGLAAMLHGMSDCISIVHQGSAGADQGSLQIVLRSTSATASQGGAVDAPGHFPALHRHPRSAGCAVAQDGHATHGNAAQPQPHQLQHQPPATLALQQRPSPSQPPPPPPSKQQQQQQQQTHQQTLTLNSTAMAAPPATSPRATLQSSAQAATQPAVQALGSWLQPQKSAVSALMEFAQHQQRRAVGGKANWLPSYRFEDSGPAGTARCTVSAGGHTIFADALDRKSAKHSASHKLMQLICPEFVKLHPLQLSMMKSAESHRAMHQPSTPTASAASTSELLALGDLLNVARGASSAAAPSADSQAKLHPPMPAQSPAAAMEAPQAAHAQCQLPAQASGNPILGQMSCGPDSAGAPEGSHDVRKLNPWSMPPSSHDARKLDPWSMPPSTVSHESNMLAQPLPGTQMQPLQTKPPAASLPLLVSGASAPALPAATSPRSRAPPPPPPARPHAARPSPPLLQPWQQQPFRPAQSQPFQAPRPPHLFQQPPQRPLSMTGPRPSPTSQPPPPLALGQQHGWRHQSPAQMLRNASLSPGHQGSPQLQPQSMAPRAPPPFMGRVPMQAQASMAPGHGAFPPGQRPWPQTPHQAQQRPMHWRHAPQTSPAAQPWRPPPPPHGRNMMPQHTRPAPPFPPAPTSAPYMSTQAANVAAPVARASMAVAAPQISHAAAPPPPQQAAPAPPDEPEDGEICE